MKRIIITALLILISFTEIFAAKVINLAAPSFMPFNGVPSGNSEGYMVEVFREIFESRGYKVNYELMPKRRSLFYMKTGRIDATLIINRLNAPDFIYPDESFGFVSDTFYTRKDSKWRFVGTDSLKELNIGGFAGYPYGSQIIRYIRNNKNIELLTGTNTIERNLLKLLNGRIDVLIATPQVVKWIESRNFIPRKIEERGTIGTEKMIHLAFSPSNKNAGEYSRIFSEGINELRRNGKFEKILRKYNQSDWKPYLKSSLNKKIVIAQIGKAQVLDPAVATDLYSFEVINNILEGLVRYSDESTDVEPCLAESWKISGDRKNWIFNLRRGVKFHDGKPFDAYAVVKNFERQLGDSPEVSKKFAYAQIAFANVKEVKALNKYQVMIRLSNPYAPFIYNLAMPAAMIVNPDTLNNPKSISAKPVGTGPFKFFSRKKDSIVLKRNDNYWGKKAYVGTVEFRSMESSKILNQFKKGKVGIMCDFTPETALKIVNMKKVKLLLSPVMHVSYIAFNTEKKPLKSTEVRFALNHAVKKKELVNELYKGFAVVSKTSIPPSMWGHNEDIKDFAFDPVKARSIIKKHNLINHSFNLWIVDRAVNILSAQRLKADFNKVGIKLNILRKKASEFYRGVKRGDHDLALLDWYGDNGDPDNFLYVLFDKNNTVKGKATNRSFIKDENLHKILIEAQRLLRKDKRSLLYRKAQERIRELAPWIHLYHKQMLVWANSRIHGVIVHPTGSILLRKVWIE